MRRVAQRLSLSSLEFDELFEFEFDDPLEFELDELLELEFEELLELELDELLELEFEEPLELELEELFELEFDEPLELEFEELLPANCWNFCEGASAAPGRATGAVCVERRILLMPPVSTEAGTGAACEDPAIAVMAAASIGPTL